jgi:dTDP-4-amino-4,6-dideoxygalactose transaminase
MEKIYITKTFSAPLDEYIKELSDIWDSHVFSNDGPKVIKFKENLKKYFSLGEIFLMCNGTLPIQIGLRSVIAPGKTEIITTPFSYIATTSAILWEGGVPIFIDIDPVNLTIDEKLIEEKISSKTAAILATHVYGNPCNINAIELISKKYNIPVIYDGAHAVGVEYKNKSLLTFGDISTTSFHATKVLHTGEGGMAIVNNPLFKKKVAQMMNFGHITASDFGGIGINAKMSELSGALGVCNLRHFERHIHLRKENFNIYDSSLKFNNYNRFNLRDFTKPNYSYYPIIFESEQSLIKVQSSLESIGVFPRRYFYPSLSKLQFLPKFENTPISDSIAQRVLCLPISAHYTYEQLSIISKRINKV